MVSYTFTTKPLFRFRERNNYLGEIYTTGTKLDIYYKIIRPLIKCYWHYNVKSFSNCKNRKWIAIREKNWHSCQVVIISLKCETGIILLILSCKFLRWWNHNRYRRKFSQWEKIQICSLISHWLRHFSASHWRVFKDRNLSMPSPQWYVCSFHLLHRRPKMDVNTLPWPQCTDINGFIWKNMV